MQEDVLIVRKNRQLDIKKERSIIDNFLDRTQKLSRRKTKTENRLTKEISNA